MSRGRRGRTLPPPPPELVDKSEFPGEGTKPDGLPPLPVLAEESAEIDAGVRVAESLDNLALKLHGYAQELRHDHRVVPWQQRKRVSEDLHATADDIYPEGRRANG